MGENSYKFDKSNLCYIYGEYIDDDVNFAIKNENGDKIFDIISGQVFDLKFRGEERYKQFLKEEKNSVDAMYKNFLKEKESRLDADQSLSSYIVQKNDTIEVKEIDNKLHATVTTATLIGVKGDKSQVVYENFMCRKDSDNKWKILGWQQVSADEAEDAGVSVNLK